MQLPTTARKKYKPKGAELRSLAAVDVDRVQKYDKTEVELSIWELTPAR
jgi:hypothetical protein